MNFEKEHIEIVEQYKQSALDIERIVFTHRYNYSPKHYSLLSVQTISILYSYWEGYIQRSFQLYVDCLNELDLDFKDYSDNITIFHMENTFKQFLEYPEKKRKKVLFYNALNEHFSKNKHNLFRIVNTESNVDFKTLNKLLEQFALEPFPEHWDIYTYPEPNLRETLDTFLRYRNGVAHGGDISSEEKISQAVYSKYRMLVNKLMDAIHDRFIKGIDQETYKNK